MILVDTSVWMDHLHRSELHLVQLLGLDEVGTHPLVIEELALGHLKSRTATLRSLESLTCFPVLGHHEVMTLVTAHGLWGRGLSATDAHLLGGVVLQPGGQLWTRDKAMLAAATELRVPTLAEVG